ncbi:alpha/beta-hydrolase [Massarina eburnea CBS 473.64]|uniref:Alpha/beta-hydrolase n=1 Tax=Massarina eburnea CBS 473.64 TaxID=1395130 RepID=A0A6A6RXR6_9PLEO|nr:alpha/beta-hydrolase [Massarina eburnea CBS 473.64]
MASNPIGRCCAVGVKHEGTTTGEEKTIGGVKCYVAYPEDKKTENALIIFTDIMGYGFNNVRLIADQYAANGYFTVIPDLFNGNEVDLNQPFDIQKYIAEKMPRVPTVDPITTATIKGLREEYAVKRLGGVGYCFGGKYVIRFLKQGGLDVGYTAHPSFVDKEEVEGMVGPLSIAAAETDQIFPAEKRRETEDILQKLEAPYQMNLFSDVSHGFAVRCDLSKPREKFAKEQAFLQAVAWFDEYLKA